MSQDLLVSAMREVKKGYMNEFSGIDLSTPVQVITYYCLTGRIGYEYEGKYKSTVSLEVGKDVGEEHPFIFRCFDLREKVRFSFVLEGEESGLEKKEVKNVKCVDINEQDIISDMEYLENKDDLVDFISTKVLPYLSWGEISDAIDANSEPAFPTKNPDNPIFNDDYYERKYSHKFSTFFVGNREEVNYTTLAKWIKSEVDERSKNLAPLILEKLETEISDLNTATKELITGYIKRFGNPNSF